MMSSSPNKHYTRSLYIDLEQACWMGRPPEGLDNNIIQIGIAEADLINLKVTRTKRYYVRPRKFEINWYCTKLTGITHDDIIKQGRPLGEVMSSIQREFGPKNKMCFAWGRDDEDIQQECLTHSIANPFGNTIIDLGVMFRGSFLMKNNMKLHHALEFLGLAFEGRAHDAMVDATNTARLHIEMIRLLRGTKVNASLL